MPTYSFEYWDELITQQRIEIKDLEDKLAKRKEQHRKTIFKKIAWEYGQCIRIFGPIHSLLNNH